MLLHVLSKLMLAFICDGNAIILLIMLTSYLSDPVLHSSTGERSDVRTLLQKLILEEDQFAVEDILPNTVPDPASLQLSSEYACPIGQVVMVPDCGKGFIIINMLT